MRTMQWRAELATPRESNQRVTYQVLYRPMCGKITITLTRICDFVLIIFINLHSSFSNTITLHVENS
jgi:hypothetical protein